MTGRRPLPEGLDAAFRVGVARAAGASRKRLLASDLDARFWGGRADPALTPERQLLPLLRPGDAFAGLTAARIWGIPLPLGVDPRLHVSSMAPVAAMRRPGVRGTSRRAGPPVRHDGLPVLDPAATWASLSGSLAWWDLTAAADHLLTARRGRAALATRQQLAAVVAPGARGAIRLRRALEASRSGAWSRPESLLRILIAAAGLPEPELNAELVLTSGRLVVIDIAWIEHRIAIEYDGRWHDSEGRPAQDAIRHEELVDDGWLVVHVRSEELFATPSAVVARLIRRRTERGARSPSIDFARMPRLRP